MTKGIKGFQKGHPTFISPETYKKIGETLSKQRKGKPIKSSQGFQKGHTIQLGDKHWAWKGDAVGHASLHDWLKRRVETINKCEHCGATTAKKYEWANKSHEYKRDITDWLRLCVSCHRKYDGHAIKMWETRRKLQV